MATPEDYLPYEIPPDVDYSWCQTDMKETRFSYLWTIKKFSFLQEKNGQHIKSAIFSSRDDDRNKWCLLFYPNGDTIQSQFSVSLYLQHPFGQLVSNVAFEFCIISDKGKRRRRVGGEESIFRVGATSGYSDFVERDDIMDERQHLLRNDELTILCELVIGLARERENTSGRFKRVRANDSKSFVSEDLSQLLENRNFSDVVLVAEERELHAHKNILAFRSPVFAGMFMHDIHVEEKQDNRVEIADTEYEILEVMVRYIYSRRAPKMDDAMATKLLAAADKFALEELKDVCEEFLSTDLTSEKVIALMPLVSIYNTSRLKTSLIDFVKMHAGDGATDRLWDNLISHHPNHAVEVFCGSTAPNQELLQNYSPPRKLIKKHMPFPNLNATQFTFPS